MSEATSRWHADNAEISGLLAELELQIEAVTADLNKVRGTVARISYAALTATPAPIPPALATDVEPARSGPTSELPPATPAPVPNWQDAPLFNTAPGAAETLPEPGFWDSVAEGASWPRSKPQEAIASAPDVQDNALEPGTEPDAPAPERSSSDWMWTPLRAEGLTEAAAPSIIEDELPTAELPQPATTWEGAWQTLKASDTAHLRAETDGAADALPAIDPAAVEGEAVEEPTGWASGWRTEAMAHTAIDATPEITALSGELQDGISSEAGRETSDEPSMDDEAAEAPGSDDGPAAVAGVDADRLEEPPSTIAGDEMPVTPEADGLTVADGLIAADEATDEATDETPAGTVEEPASGVPSALSFGWPDESIWSQNFEWPAMRPKGSPASRSESTDPERGGVSDIVAQVRAEMEAGLDQDAASVLAQIEGSAAADGSAVNYDGGTSIDAEPARGEDIITGEEQSPPLLDAENVAENDNDALVAALSAWEAGSDAAALEPEQPDDAAPPEQDDATRRDEVSRAVAAIRRQMESGGMQSVLREAEERTGDFGPGPVGPMGNGEKPAFRLAAPGSIPDWSHVPLEPSGPPVVVLKDADGRVELASVFDTLSELGCGDGAALLNYTPHSVTVGLPASAQVPSPGQMAEAVERVFGLVSRVESDGVRITVNIGEDPKKRSVGAA